MKHLKLISDYIREIAGTEPELVQGIVHAVAGDGTFSVETDADTVIHNVKVNVIASSGMGVRVTPAKGSPVVIARIDGGVEYQLLRAEKIDRVQVRIGSTIVDAHADGVTLNEGKLGGLVVVAPTRDALMRLEQNTTILRNACSAMAATLNSVSPGISAAFEAAVAGMQPVDLSAIENQKVKQ